MNAVVSRRTPEEIAVISRAAALAAARRSTRDYLPHCTVRSDDPARPEPVRLRPWPYQVALAERLDAHESMVILKSRQLGCSTFLRAYVGRRAAEESWAVGYYSRGQEEAVAWLDGLGEMLSDLPPELRPRLSRTGNLLRINGGSVRVHPGTQAAGVGYTYQLVIADEAAHHPYGRENYANYAPTLSAGGQFIGLSTADPALGPSGWFYELWQGAVAGTLPYSALFLGWGERPDRDAAWLAARRAELAGDEHAFRANYPESPEDAFLGREGLVYPMFARERHIIPEPVAWEHALRRYCATDYGGGDPTAAPVGGVWRRAGEGFSRLHIYDTFYREQGAPSIDEIASWLGQWHQRARIWRGAGDPAPGGAVLNESIHALTGITFVRGNAARGEGLGLVAMYLERGWLTFDERIRAIAEREILAYRWREQTDPNSHERYATSTPVDNHADLLDAVRIMLMQVYADEMAQGSARSVAVQW